MWIVLVVVGNQYIINIKVLRYKIELLFILQCYWVDNFKISIYLLLVVLSTCIEQGPTRDTSVSSKVNVLSDCRYVCLTLLETKGFCLRETTIKYNNTCHVRHLNIWLNLSGLFWFICLISKQWTIILWQGQISLTGHSWFY